MRIHCLEFMFTRKRGPRENVFTRIRVRENVSREKRVTSFRMIPTLGTYAAYVLEVDNDDDDEEEEEEEEK